MDHIRHLGYVVVYGLTDILVDWIAQIENISAGRGFAWVVMAAGVILCLASVIVPRLRSVKD